MVRPPSEWTMAPAREYIPVLGAFLSAQVLCLTQGRKDAFRVVNCADGESRARLLRRFYEQEKVD
jgi:hypothetical protein